VWPLGWRRTPRRPIFVLYHEKCFFHFWSTEIGFFHEAATETRNRKLGKTPHINSRPPGIRISALVLLRNPSEVFFEFCATSCRFYWNRGGFCTVALKSKPPNFLQKSFLDPQHVISSLNKWGKQESAPPGREQDFSGVVISCGSQIGRN
jgi:hypothetical protein